jgi:hypothetical protein
MAPPSPPPAVDTGANASRMDVASLRRIFAIRTNQLIYAQALPGEFNS